MEKQFKWHFWFYFCIFIYNFVHVLDVVIFDLFFYLCCDIYVHVSEWYIPVNDIVLEY